MAKKIVCESGLQLLARLSSRPSLYRLDNVIFPNDLQPGDVVQISGKSGTGKSLLLLRLMTKCLLPKYFKNIEIGGLGIGVILIDTEHSISILKLVSLIEQFVQSSLNSKANKSVSLKSQELESFVEEVLKDALNRLIILKTYTSLQLQMNFHSLVKILSANSNVSVVMIDSLTSYYWADRVNVNSIKKMDLYLKVMIENLLKCIRDFKIITIFVKQEYFQSKKRDIKLNQITHKIDLWKSDKQKDLFCACTNNVQGTCNYTISDNGFQWVTHE